MAFGIQIKNNSDQILIDSELSHYHFLGKYTHYASTQTPDLLDGPGTVAYGPNDNKNMNGMPQKGSIFKYSIPSNGPKPPMIFIQNKDVYRYTRCSNILTKKSGSNWEVWIFSTGDISEDFFLAPIVFAFSPREQFATSPSGYGLVTYDSSGNPTFDSNLKPLRVVGGGNITAPPVAHTGSFGGVFISTLGVNSSDVVVGGGVPNSLSQVHHTDIIFYCPSIAHACHQYEYQASDSGISDWQNYAWSRGDIWWCFYRSTFRVNNGYFSGNLVFHANYGVYARGHVWQHVSNSSSIFAALILGALTGGAYFALALGVLVTAGVFTSAGVASGGYLPYSNGSRNASLQNTFILSRASYYE